MIENRFRRGAALLAGIAGICFVLGLAAPSSSQSPPSPAPKETPMAQRATGPFDVKLTPQSPGEGEAAIPGRLSIDKQFHGDLEAASQGVMLAVTTSVQGSAGYVAIEQVTGTLHGRKGTFILQHSGTMNRGEPHLTITVVPDSGTGELTGLTGTMTIDIAAGGKHSYNFEYTLATPAAQ